MPNKPFDRQAKEPEWKLLHQIADGAAPKVRKKLIRALSEVKDGIPMERVRRALSKGDVEQAFRLIDEVWQRGSQEIQSNLTSIARDVLEEVAVLSATFLPPKAQIRLDLVNPRVVDTLRDFTSTIFDKFNENTKKGIRLVITRSIEEGIPPRQAAVMIRDFVGLGEKQELSVFNFQVFLRNLAAEGPQDVISKAVLERLKRGGLRNPNLLNEEKILRAVNRFKNRIIARNAETLAREMMITAANRGQQVLWDEAVEKGLLDPERTQQEWLVTPDDRLCPICLPMDGQRRPLGGTFSSPYNGATAVSPTIHPGCRCALRLVITRRQFQEAA